jgi:mRNA guanylyltransferase
MVGSVPQIPGEPLTNGPQNGNQLDCFREEVAKLLGRRNANFPGAQPVSFTKEHFKELETKDYYLCEKTDGIRCLLYCTHGDHDEEVHYLIDRKNDYYYVTSSRLTEERMATKHPWPIGFSGLHLPHHEDKSYRRSHTSSILDGELVLDRERDAHGNVREILRYMVFDCLLLDGENLTQKAFDKRIGRFHVWVEQPFREAYKLHPEERRYLPFEMVFKAMDKPYGLEAMFQDKLPNLPHGNDGLIFTCKETPYVMGTDPHILKWKPEHENSIDFRLKIGHYPIYEQDGEVIEDYEGKPFVGLEVFYGQHAYAERAELYIDDADWEAMKYAAIRDKIPLDGRIIECWLEHLPDGDVRWRFKREADGTPRFRDDKNDANHISTVDKVLESIRDGVSQKDLIEHAPDIMKAWKSRHPEEELEKRKREDAAKAQQARVVPSRRPPRPPNGHM